MAERYLFADLWRQIFEWFDMIIDSFSNISTFISSPLGVLVADIDNSVLQEILSGLLDLLSIRDVSILSFMFGSLLPFILLVAVFKFFLDLF